MGWAIALLAATAAHAGFQLAVTLVVYPTFGRVAASEWAAVHAGHSRGIAPLVGVLYAALLVALAGCALVGPTGPGSWVAAGGTALALGTTAAVAAPLHGRLGGGPDGGPGGQGPDPRLLVRLRRADAVRTLGALVALAGAVSALVRA